MIWAREEMELDIEDVAKAMSKDKSVVEEWESSGENISFAEIKKLGKIYKRQISVFFLNSPPEKIPIPKDRRNMSIKENRLNKETVLAIRRTNRYLQLARELSDNESLEQQYRWLEVVQKIKNLEEIAQYLRDVIGVTIEDQKKFNGSDTALRKWRESIESNLGIYTFSFLMPIGEIDGFSYIESGKPFAITINSRLAKNRNIFTLFHEIAHIIEGQSGICLTTGDKNSSNPERRCDSFAAAFLLPSSSVKAPNNYEELRELAKEMSVSSEAYARRAQSLNLITLPEMDELISKIPKKKKTQKGEIKIPQLVMSKSRRGEKFFNLVVDAYSEGRVSSSLLRDVLEVRSNKIDGMQ